MPSTLQLSPGYAADGMPLVCTTQQCPAALLLLESPSLGECLWCPHAPRAHNAFSNPSGFPLAVLLVVMTGAELFTGNTFFLPLAILEKKASVQQLLKSWFFSYIGNVLGCLLLVTAVQQTGLLAQAAAPGKMSVVKTSLTTAQVGLLAADDST